MQKRRYLLFAVGLVISGLIIALIFLHTATAERLLVGKLKKHLESRYDLSLELGVVDYNLLQLSASARDFSLGTVTQGNLPDLFSAKYVDLDLSLLDLLLGKLTIETARAETVSLTVILDERGESNLPSWSESTSGESDLFDTEMLISSLIVKEGSFSLKDEARGVQLDVPEWALKIAGQRSTGNHSINLSTGARSEIRIQNKALLLEPFEAKTSLSSEGLRLESVEIQWDKSELKVVGLVPLSPAADLDAEVRVSIEASKLAHLFGLTEPVSGLLEGKISLGDSLQAPTLEAQLTGEKLSWRTIDGIDLSAKIEWKIKEARVTVKDALVATPRGSLRATSLIALTKGAGNSEASFQISKFDFGWWSKLLESEYRVASLGSGEVSLSWPGLELGNFLGSARLLLAASRPSVRAGFLPASGTILLNATPENVLVSSDNVTLNNTHLAGEATVQRTEFLQDLTSGRLSGRISAYADDLGSVFSGVADLLGHKGSPLLRLSGKANLAAELSGTIRNPQASFKLRVPDLEGFDVRGIDLEAEGSITHQQIVLSGASAQWLSGRASLAGLLALNHAEPELGFDGSVTTLPLNPLMAALGLPIDAVGEVDAEIALTGTLLRPKLVFDARIPSLQLANEEFGSVSMAGILEQDELTLSSVSLSEPALAGSREVLTASGHLDFGNDTVLFEAAGHQLEVSSLRLAEDWKLAGLLDLSIQCRGALSNPEVDLDLQIERPSISGYELAPVAVKATLQNSQFVAKMLAADSGLSALVSGRVVPPFPIRVSIRAEDTDLGRLPFLKQAVPDLTGAVAGELVAEGVLSDWRGAQLSTMLTDLHFVWNGLEVRSQEPINIFYKNKSLMVEKCNFIVGGGSLEIEGNLPLEAARSDSRLLTGLRLDVTDLLKLLPGEWQVEGTGDLELQIEVAGSLTNPELFGQFRVSKGALTGPRFPVPISDLELTISIQGNAIELDQLSANAGGGTLLAEGVLLDFSPTPKNEPIRISASLEEFPLESLGVLPERLTGVATAQLELTSQEVELSSFSGVIAFGELQLTAGNQTLRQVEPVLLSLQNGEVWLERFELTGPDSQIAGSGGIDFLQPGSLDLRVEGSVSTTLLAELIGNFEASGKSQVELVIGGLPGPPQFSGTFSVADGTLLIPSHGVQADEMELKVRVSDNQFQLESFTGDLNGGSFEGDGTVHYSSGKIEAELLAVITDIYLDWPPGLRTISDGVIALRSTEKGFLFDGELRILEGAYRERFDLGGSLFQYLKTGRQVEIDLEPDPLLSGLEFEIGIETIDPILVDNNLAELVLEGRLELRGNYYRPGMRGVITVEPGGQVYLRGKTYVVEYGAISFLEDNRIRPDVNIRAQTKVKEYDVTLQAVGPVGDIKTSFSSEPALAEPDIVSVLLTGRTLEELRGAEASVATEQALALLVGAAGSQAESAFGLTKVRIEPYLIAPESTPEARLTVAQNITSDLRGIYSVNLADSGDQIWVAEYDITRRFRTRGIKQTDNTYRFDFSHQLRLGTSKRANKFAQQRRIGAILFEGSSPFTETLLRDTFRVQTDQTYDFFKTQKGLEKVRGLFRAQDLLEAQIRLQRAELQGTVDLTMKLETGPTIALAFEGDEISSDTQKRVRELWSQGVSDSQRQREALQEIRRRQFQQGYMQAEVTCEILLAQDEKKVTFRVQKGPQFQQNTIAFKGVEAFDEEWLRTQLKQGDLIRALYLEPGETSDFLKGLYRQRGYLEADTKAPEFSFDLERSEALVVIEIVEGPLFRVGEIHFQGNRVIDEATLKGAIGFKKGDVYYPGIRGEAVARVKELYLSKGYNRSEISDTAQLSENYLVDITFPIVENVQDIVTQIEITGQRRVSVDFIERQMGIGIGEILDLEKVSRARKSLYDTGAFSLVEIEPVEIENAKAGVGNDRPMGLKVRVRESVPHTISYGAFFDTDRGPGVTADYRNHNLLRNGRVLGVRGRLDSDRQELRGYFSQPARRWFPLRTHMSSLVAREFRPSFEFDQVGFSIEEQAELKETLIGSFGFSFEKNRVRQNEPDAKLDDVPLNIGAVNTALAWDTRDSFLDATRGHFLSNAFKFAPAQFGSDFPFIRYFGSYSRYFPLTKPSKIPFAGDLQQPRLIFATGARIGLAKGFDQDIISPTERFFAGGGTTIRGFKQDTVGPVNSEGVPVGGNSLFIWNNELRFPMFSILEGVGFLDMGNVYSTISDFNPLELREAAGFGLRIRTPFFLVRFDYGFKLDRQPGESRGAFFFSIGQAF